MINHEGDPATGRYPATVRAHVPGTGQGGLAPEKSLANGICTGTRGSGCVPCLTEGNHRVVGMTDGGPCRRRQFVAGRGLAVRVIPLEGATGTDHRPLGR